MSKSDIKLPGSSEYENVDLQNALETRYLTYALSTIMHRALPDARDGLKPVHRRLLYAMQELKLSPGSVFKKCARVVGDVIGKFHPHGEQAVYDALVRLSQDFSQRYPLIDGQGNFGNIDGDNAAAMRYTESRLTNVSAHLLTDIHSDTVDFLETYDGQESEPVVLPAGFPNLLANGSTGIAVGMATNVPPHNVAEICSAALHLIKHPQSQPQSVMQYIPGPDFPTGGIVVSSPAELEAIYSVGRGTIHVRARWIREDLPRGNWHIVVTQIPPQVPKARLIEKIANLLHEKKLPLVSDLRDESTDVVRIVIEPRSRQSSPELLMESLFHASDLETRFAVNINVLVDGRVPRTIGLQEAVRIWLDHRREVLIRRSRHRLLAIQKRIAILDGFLIAFLNIDEVIAIIRDTDSPKAELMARFSLNEIQAEAILNLRLRSLRKLEEMEMRVEHTDLSKECASLETLLGSQTEQWTFVAGEIRALRKTFGPNTPHGARRTTFESRPALDRTDVTSALVVREAVTVIVTEKGWIRRVRGDIDSPESVSVKSGDAVQFIRACYTTDRLLLAAENGRMLTVTVESLPGGRGMGDPLRLMIELDDKVGITDVWVLGSVSAFLMASRMGRGMVVEGANCVSAVRRGKQIFNPSGSDRLLRCVPVLGDTIACVSSNKKMLCFPRDQLSVLKRGSGTRMQRMGEANLVDVSVFSRTEGLAWQSTAGRRQKLNDFTPWMGTRAGPGKPTPRGFPRNSIFFPKSFDLTGRINPNQSEPCQ